MKINLLIALFLLSILNCNYSKEVEENSFKDECKNMFFFANDENVKFLGRYYLNGTDIWLVQSGSSIEFILKGKTASIVLAGDKSINSEKEYRPRFGIYIEDQLYLDSLMDVEERTVELFKGPGEKEVKVKVMLLSEGLIGGVGVKSINVYTCSSNIPLIRPTPKKDLSIEFLGDSLTCAYAVETTVDDIPFSSDTENYAYSYTYLAAKELNADYSTMCSSGTGFTFCYDMNGYFDNNIDKFYTNISRYDLYQYPWDFEKHQHDVIFINLGSNDYYSLKDTDSDEVRNKKLEAFKDAYLNFLKLVREKNPNSYIINGYGIFGFLEMYPMIEKAVKEFNDPKTFEFQFPVQNITEDGAGKWFHPRIKTHKKEAKVLVEKIREFLAKKLN